MGEIDKLREDLIGAPVPFTSKGEQACELCDEMNQVCEKNRVPLMKDSRFEDGDKVLFRSSRPNPMGVQESTEHVITSIFHASHDGEYDDFILAGSKDNHDFLAFAVTEVRRVDFGRLQSESFNLEYKPDLMERAVTLTDIEVIEYIGPSRGKTITGGEGEDPPDPLYNIRGLWGYWPAKMQTEVASWVQSHR